MNKFYFKFFILFILIIILEFPLFAQEKVVKFSLEDVINLAKEQSPDAVLARHRFRASYWQYRSYKANYMPGLKFRGTLPSIDHSVSSTTEKDSAGNFYDVYYQSQTNKYSGALSLSQNIGLTGGTISLNSALERRDQFSKTKTFTGYPVLDVSVDQPLFGYNEMKWDRKIQPLVFEEAKKNYLDAIEQVSLRAIGRFFDLAAAQLNLKIAQINFNNSDTLYKIAQGRYNIGTIAENDLLQMQLSYLNAKTDLTKAEIDLELQKSRLRSFLGYNEKMDFNLMLPDNIPALKVEYQKVLDLAMKNNPDVLARQRQLIEALRDVAQAKGAQRNINLSASYGLSKYSQENITSVYRNPNESKQLNITISAPIIDWGQGRGRVKMAQSNRELINVQVQQAQTDFEQNIFLEVMQFNLQNDQVMIAAKADTIAQNRYDVTKQRFLIGKIDVLNLNDALREKDSSKRGYINALRDYWNYYYLLRQLTLFDFINNQDLQEDVDSLVQ